MREQTTSVDREPAAPNGTTHSAPHRDGVADGAFTDGAARNGNGHASRPPGQPRISVIVPALNEERLVERTLRCFPPEMRRKLGIELIVSDGGSSDRTVEIARKHADAVAVHAEPRRQTIAEGRNRGAERARGDLLVFINADTIPRSPEKFLERLARIAEGCHAPGAFAAWACPVRIAPEERRLSDTLFHTFFNNHVRLLNAIGVGMGRGECQVVRRDAFVAVGGYQNHMAAGEDFDLYKRLARHGGIGHSDELCVYESPRRFRRYGYLRVLAEWTLNGLSVIFLRRSISKEWEQIR